MYYKHHNITTLLSWFRFHETKLLYIPQYPCTTQLLFNIVFDTYDSQIEDKRAIAFGTSYVNGGLALALITLSFGDTVETNNYIMFPMLYTASQLVMAIAIGRFIH